MAMGADPAPGMCMANGACSNCGGSGQKCCFGSAGKGEKAAYCSALDTVCVGGIAGTCAACGKAGQPCCVGDYCVAGVSCGKDNMCH
jgi:hypothetical protein